MNIPPGPFFYMGVRMEQEATELLDIERVFQSCPKILGRDELKRLGFRYFVNIDEQRGYKKEFFAYELGGKTLVYKESNGVFQRHRVFIPDPDHPLDGDL